MKTRICFLKCKFKSDEENSNFETNSLKIISIRVTCVIYVRNLNARGILWMIHKHFVNDSGFEGNEIEVQKML